MAVAAGYLEGCCSRLDLFVKVWGDIRVGLILGHEVVVVALRCLPDDAKNVFSIAVAVVFLALALLVVPDEVAGFFPCRSPYGSC